MIRSPRARWLPRLALVALGLLAAAGVAEVALRVAGPVIGRARYEAYFEDAARQRVDYAAAKDRGLVQLPGLPRGRATWSPDLSFYLCYRDNHGPVMDERGCVRVDINSIGLRDRSDLTWAKPAGQQRVVCLGDSFTFGWGVPAELTWVRRVEAELQKGPGGDAIRLVNCGAAGTLYVDEYWWALRDRFHALQPDVVVVTLCLNDIALMPNTVALEAPATFGAKQPLALIRAFAAAYDFRHRFDLDPAVDWGQALLDLPPSDAFYAARAESADMFWAAGAPQLALREMQAWCRARGIGFGVVVWPLFQNLEPGAHYPFHTLHRVVAEFCAAEAIPALDLLPAFAGQRSDALWVDPADMHGNEVAHALATPLLVTFTKTLLR